MVEEFYPEGFEVEPAGNPMGTGNKVGLADKLNQKAEKLKVVGVIAPAS